MERSRKPLPDDFPGIGGRSRIDGKAPNAYSKIAPLSQRKGAVRHIMILQFTLMSQ